MADLTGSLDQALSTTADVIDGISSEQWQQTSVCEEWSVRQLVEHLVGGCALTGQVLQGEDAHGRPTYEGTSDHELTVQFRQASQAVLLAVDEPAALEQTVRVGMGPVPGSVAAHLALVEAIVHGWDVASSTGQAVAYDEGTVTEALDFSRGMMDQIPAGRSPFKPSFPVAEDAPPLSQLLGLLGRAP
ncbi:MAG: TIGR03086 family metal-binding protein [Ornithinimicrobium sp.]